MINVRAPRAARETQRASRDARRDLGGGMQLDPVCGAGLDGEGVEAVAGLAIERERDGACDVTHIVSAAVQKAR